MTGGTGFGSTINKGQAKNMGREVNNCRFGLEIHKMYLRNISSKLAKFPNNLGFSYIDCEGIRCAVLFWESVMSETGINSCYCDR